MTTGATLDAAAAALRVGPAHAVDAWVVARTLPPRTEPRVTDVRRRARPARNPAEHRQRDPPHRQHGDRAAPGRAARLSHGRPRAASARASTITNTRKCACTATGAACRAALDSATRASAGSRSRRRRRRLALRRALSAGDVLVFGCETAGLPAVRSWKTSRDDAAARAFRCGRACAASTCPTRWRSPSTRRGGSRISAAPSDMRGREASFEI